MTSSSTPTSSSTNSTPAKFSFCDSLIVAAALEAGCNRLLTEDLKHGQRVETLRIENPFRK